LKGGDERQVQPEEFSEGETETRLTFPQESIDLLLVERLKDRLLRSRWRLEERRRRRRKRSEVKAGQLKSSTWNAGVEIKKTNQIDVQLSGESFLELVEKRGDIDRAGGGHVVKEIEREGRTERARVR